MGTDPRLDGAAALQPQAPQSQIPQADFNMLLTMVQLLLDEKREAAEERKRIKLVQNERNESAKKIAAYNEKDARMKQIMCTHQKNQPSRHHLTPKALKVDYAVSYHIYPDGVAKIKCLICSAKWHKGDTVQLWGPGSQYAGKKNWTKKGWNEALAMVAESSNTPTKSELNLDPTGTFLGPGVAKDVDEYDD